MWRSMPLRRRLNLGFAVLFLIWLGVDVGRLVAEVGPRARAETASAARLTKDLIVTTLSELQDQDDPRAGLQALVESVQYVRHVRVGFGELSIASAMLATREDPEPAPDWFRRLTAIEASVITIPIVMKRGRYPSIVIVADPADLIDEAWASAKREAVIAGGVALLAMLATRLFVTRALRPIGIAGDALARLRAGDYFARARADGAPEFAAICEAINALAGTLASLRAENDRLIGKLFAAHDEERGAIAHDLHDEFGPHLFALRANAAMLASKLRGAGDPRPEASAAQAIADGVEALQRHNRRILANLRPAALEELGLRQALTALVEHWRRVEPEVEISLEAPDRLVELGRAASAMIYRFVQEALTNAYRHADAHAIRVELIYESTLERFSGADPALAGLRVAVSDDGRGIAADAAMGMGMTGLRERARLHGGVTTFAASPDGGTVVEARFGTTPK